jgi:hypothetical protein
MKTHTETLTTQALHIRQVLFIRYLTAILIDLTVLNLFEEYWDAVIIESFTISLLAAILLQLLLKLTIALEHRVAARFKDGPGGGAKVKRLFTTWVILFGSKFVILGALDITFGNKVLFTGAFHGIVTLIVVLVAMLAAEALVSRITHSLGVTD